MALAASFLTAGQYQARSQLMALAGTCGLVRCVGELVHHLQAERGATNLTLGTQGARFEKLWQDRCQSSDHAKERFEYLLSEDSKPLIASGGSRFCFSVALSLNELDQLTAIRQQTQDGHHTPIMATRQYCQIIRSLLSLIFEAINAVAEPSVAKLLVALFNLIEGKEACGIERANGARMFSAESITPEDLSLLSDLIAQQEQAFGRFEAFCDPTTMQQWRILQTLLPLAEIERMRRILLGGIANNSEDAHQWFTCCSERIDRLHEVEQHLANHLEAVCRERIAESEISYTATTENLDSASGILPLSQSNALLEPRIHRDLYDLLQEKTRQLEMANQELASVRASLEDRKLIERAKGLLMSQQGISETEAYGLIRQKAMNQKIRMADIAQAVITMADLIAGADKRT